jgi:hypothetical protein
MKKIIVLLLCFAVFCFPISAFAEGEETTPPSIEDGVVEDELTNEVDWNEVKNTISGYITGWILPHIEEISVILTIIFSCIYNFKRNKLLNKSIATVNNNAIAIAQDSSASMNQALTQVETASNAVISYDARITAMLDAFDATLKENNILKTELAEIRKYLHTSTEANIEFANELAELLTLANIPNYIKEDLGRRHVANVDAIRLAEAAAEAKAVLPEAVEEVKENDGEEA